MVKIIGNESIALLIVIGIISCFVGCIEEIEIEETIQSGIIAEDILVVEATITNEFKNQQVSLSRARSFANDSTMLFESNASVRIVDDLGNTFEFEDQGNGNYISEVPFATENIVSYQLLVTTINGEELQSGMVSSVGESKIDEIYSERIFSDSGVEGMAIFVDSSNPSEGFNNYRYNYEETYKIIAPNWTSREFEIIREELEFGANGALFPDVTLVPRKEEERVCYNTVLSNEIILSDGTKLNRNTINRNLVRFVNRENAILSHRYSILIRQFLQSPDAAEFYRTLLQFSQSENVFSEVQPGLIEGNVTSVDGSDTVVIGYFDVASVAERRLFFDYADFFPNEDLPPYFGTVNCNRLLAPILGNPDRDGPIPPGGCGETLVQLIQQERIEFFESNSESPEECEGPYLVTQRACGDCTSLGSNVVPDFWIE